MVAVFAPVRTVREQGNCVGGGGGEGGSSVANTCLAGAGVIAWLETLHKSGPRLYVHFSVGVGMYPTYVHYFKPMPRTDPPN